MRLLYRILLACLLLAVSASAQSISRVAQPTLAVHTDGSYAVAYEAIVDDISPEWNVAVQRYAASGTALGPLHLFEGESCSTLDIWTSDFMYSPDLAFQSDGTLLVIMTHQGEWSAGPVSSFTAETTLGALDAQGQVIDLNSAGGCLQYKLIFPGGGKQTGPRVDVGASDAVYLIHQGRFDDAFATNVALRVLDAAGNNVVEQFIPHADPRSAQSFHASPDIAASASTVLAVWHECVMIDNQGNTNDCDIGAQFFDAQTGNPLGSNVKVNDVGVNQANTYSLYPRATMNAAGQSVVVWGDTRTSVQGDVFAQRFDASGQPIGGNIQVSEGQGEITDTPEVAMQADGRFMVVWEDSSAVGFAARGRAFAANGQPLGRATFLSAGGEPAVAASGNDFVATWLDGSGNVPTIRTQSVGSTVAVDERETPEGRLRLISLYPNPFTTEATVAYDVPQTGPVRLSVYDLLGREVARLVDEVQAAGAHRVYLRGADLAAGAYVLRLQQGGGEDVRLIVRAL